MKKEHHDFDIDAAELASSVADVVGSSACSS